MKQKPHPIRQPDVSQSAKSVLDQALAKVEKPRPKKKGKGQTDAPLDGSR
jgi:hypothetical protein